MSLTQRSRPRRSDDQLAEILDRLDAMKTDDATFRSETLPRSYIPRPEFNEVVANLKATVDRMDERINKWMANIDEWRVAVVSKQSVASSQMERVRQERSEFGELWRYAAAGLVAAIATAVLSGHILLR